MANVKVTLDYQINDGMSLTFKAPCDCTEVTGLKIYYPTLTEETTTSTSKTFTFKDAHGNDLANIGNLFTTGAYVKVILDITNGYAYIQNADTNGYLESAIFVTLTHTKNGTNHAFTGLGRRSGLVPCQFKATSSFVSGDTATIDGQAYTVVLTGSDEPETDLFVTGRSVSVTVDTSELTINFKSGGGLSNAKLAATTATEETVVSGYTFYSEDKTLKTGTYEKPTQLLVGNDVVYLVETGDGSTPEITATSNDIRAGLTAVTNDGLTLGTKNIPSYETNEGKRLITAGSAFNIPLSTNDCYDYTSLQCIICPMNTSATNSVSAEKVVIENAVYPVQSTTPESNVTKDSTNKVISLGITNNTSNTYVLRYFTYKEIE